MSGTNSGPSAAESPAISVIMPAYNATHYLAKSLPPLIALKEAGEVAEVIVADDGSSDETAKVAAEMGARVMPAGPRAGPGSARNQAVGEARGDVVWFVDADVVVHDDAAAHIRRAFEAPDFVAVFGSYDDRPPADNFASQYKNLVHHFYHQKGSREASTFWAGCGAIRKAAFLAAGGFDVARYPYPSIEDIELGHRLRARGGRILLDTELRSTHLKLWSLGGVIHTDIFRRALPWSRLMLAEGGLVDDLNVSRGERARSALAGLVVLVCLGALATLLPWWTAPLALAAALVANWRLFRFFQARRGLGFAVAGLLFHQVYYLYSAAAFSWCWLEARLRGGKAQATADGLG